MEREHTLYSAAGRAPARKTKQTAALIESPVVRTLVLERTRHHLAMGVRGEISALVVADLRSRWQSLTEASVDLIIAAEVAALQAEIAMYRVSMQGALKAGQQAAADVRAEVAEICRPIQQRVSA